jgi:hypothetical protein
MKQLSASEMKKRTAAASLNRKPKEGSKLRQIYDLLMENKGKVVQISSDRQRNGRIRDQLTDIYGLDIAFLNPTEWQLIGEITNSGEYINYREKEST